MGVVEVEAAQAYAFRGFFFFFFFGSAKSRSPLGLGSDLPSVRPPQAGEGGGGESCLLPHRLLRAAGTRAQPDYAKCFFHAPPGDKRREWRYLA